MSEGALEYKLIKETIINVPVSSIIDRLAEIVNDRLNNYHIYEEKPYIETDSTDGHVECTLYNDEPMGEDFHNWERTFERAIETLAKELRDEGSE